MSEPSQTDEYIQELPPVAENPLFACKKCDSNRFFKIIAHKNERSAKLECEVCGAKKSFTIKKPKKKGTTTRKRTVSTKMQWDDLNKEHDTENVIRYTMKGTFLADSVLDHPKFGVGFVTESTPAKITVIFEDEVRELVHNRS
ncbi:MAG: hypothetical protein R2827_15150 [Bdellovibrionales bacterium]